MRPEAVEQGNNHAGQSQQELAQKLLDAVREDPHSRNVVDAMWAIPHEQRPSVFFLAQGKLKALAKEGNPIPDKHLAFRAYESEDGEVSTRITSIDGARNPYVITGMDSVGNELIGQPYGAVYPYGETKSGKPIYVPDEWVNKDPLIQVDDKYAPDEGWRNMFAPKPNVGALVEEGLKGIIEK